MLHFVFLVVAVLALAGCGSDEVVRDSAETEDMAVEGPPNITPAESTPAESTPPESTPAERWWNALTAGQMVAALYGDAATDEQAAAAQRMYAELDDDTRLLVDAAVEEIYDKERTYDSIGDWWQTLGCRPMRVAAGDGITADVASPYCTYYPGYGLPFGRVLAPEHLHHVNAVGAALLDYPDMPSYTPADMAAFDELVEGMTVVFTLDVPRTYEDAETVPLFKLAFTGPGEAYSFGDPNSPGKFPANYTWEHLGDDTDTGRLTTWWVPDDPEAYLAEIEMVFLGMREGVFWVDSSESGESLYVGTGTFEMMETEADAH